MKILLAPNSFKECADSVEISKILSNELRSLMACNIVEKPLSDGGDGFLTVCKKLFNANRLTYYIKNIYDNQIIPIPILYSKDKGLVIVESAEIVGLKKVPAELRNPMVLNTSCLGELIKLISDDVNTGKLIAEQLLIGIGGTATVDLGLGAASFFGLKLFDHRGIELKVIPDNYIECRKLIPPEISLPFNLKVITDVNTPLFGNKNAIEIYSKQKGADKNQIYLLVKGFTNIYNLLYKNKLVESYKMLSGAGGGLAEGLKIFFGATIVTAAEFIYNEILKDIDSEQFNAIITGEGAFDIQSLENKGAYIVIEKFKNSEIPVFLVCGSFDRKISDKLPDNVIVLELQKFFRTQKYSIEEYERGLKIASLEIANQLKI